MQKKRFTERVYINSYVQRILGQSNSDCTFSVSIDKPVNDMVGLCLDSLSIQNLFPSFYKSAGDTDFRNFSFAIAST